MVMITGVGYLRQQQRRLWRMTSARPIKKSRIKRKLNRRHRRVLCDTRNPRHVFNRHEPWGHPGWGLRKCHEEEKIGRSVPKSEEAPRTAATLSKMRDIDFVLRGTTYIASSLVLGMIYLSSVIGFTYCMPPAILIGVYKIII